MTPSHTPPPARRERRPRDGTPRAPWPLALAVTTLAAVVVLVGAGSGHAGDPAASDREALVAHGAELYAFHCSTCHGATGAGFAEAVAAFPADHQTCARCHVPRNPPTMSPSQIERNQTAFSLGVAPPLDDARVLARYGTAGGLHASVRATMPRWDPGRLDDAAYAAIVVYILDRVGMLPDGIVVDADGLHQIDLRPPD